MKKSMNNSKGFSLIELSIVLVIVGLLIGGMISGFATYRENSLIQQARDDLKLIHDALIGFATQNGYLPCPDINGPGVAGFGTENRQGGGVGPGNDCVPFAGQVNPIPVAIGFLPFADLGIGGVVLDPWGNPYAYGVDRNFATNVNPFPPPGCPSADGLTVFGFCNQGAIQIHDTGGFVIGNGVGSCAAAANCIVAANNVAAVFYSAGANGFFNPAALSTHELDNLWSLDGAGTGLAVDPDDVVYVSRAYANSGPNQFDDQVMWLSSRILINRTVQAGRLP